MRTATRERSKLRLADGTPARVGLRVIYDRKAWEKTARWHAYDDSVHEITNLLSFMIELGPTQAHGSQLRRAPCGAAVTCQDCARWPVFMHWLHRSNEAQRTLRAETHDYDLILREWPKSLPERPRGYEVTHLIHGVLTHAYPTPEEAAAELLCVFAGLLPKADVIQPTDSHA